MPGGLPDIYTPLLAAVPTQMGEKSSPPWALKTDVERTCHRRRSDGRERGDEHREESMLKGDTPASCPFLLLPITAFLFNLLDGIRAAGKSIATARHPLPWRVAPVLFYKGERISEGQTPSQ